jgi:hypothetical protein
MSCTLIPAPKPSVPAAGETAKDRQRVWRASLDNCGQFLGGSACAGPRPFLQRRAAQRRGMQGTECHRSPSALGDLCRVACFRQRPARAGPCRSLHLRAAKRRSRQGTVFPRSPEVPCGGRGDSRPEPATARLLAGGVTGADHSWPVPLLDKRICSRETDAPALREGPTLLVRPRPTG